MAYILQFDAIDTIANGSSLLSGATTTTLTSGNFGSPVGTQLYVIDYDIPANAEIISATVTGTAVTGITRGLTGGAAGTTNHSQAAKVGAFFVPQHYANGLGAVASNDAWTSYTPTWTASISNPVLGNGTITGRYFQLGKLVWFRVRVLYGSTTTYGSGDYRFTLPVTSAGSYSSQDTIGSAHAGDNSTNLFDGNTFWVSTTTVEARVFTGGAGYSKQVSSAHPIAAAVGQTVSILGCFEAA